MSGIVAGGGGLMTLLGSGATIGTASTAGGIGAATAGGLTAAGTGAGSALATGSAGISAAATGTGTLGATTTATGAGAGSLGAGGTIGSGGQAVLTPAQMIQTSGPAMTPGFQATGTGTTQAGASSPWGKATGNFVKPTQGQQNLKNAAQAMQGGGRSEGGKGGLFPMTPKEVWGKLNPMESSIILPKIVSGIKRHFRTPNRPSIPQSYYTARAEAERRRRNYMTGTAYQTKVKMIKDPTSQRNILRMGGPRAVTQSRLLADEAVKNRSINELLLGASQIEMQQQQLADQYGIMADKTRLDLDLLSDTQKRAQQARDDQAMNANLAMLPYANQEGRMSNENTNNFAMQQLLRNIYAGQQTTPTTTPSTGTIGGP